MREGRAAGKKARDWGVSESRKRRRRGKRRDTLLAAREDQA